MIIKKLFNGTYKATVFTINNDKITVLGVRKRDVGQIVKFWETVPYYTNKPSYLRIQTNLYWQINKGKKGIILKYYILNQSETITYLNDVKVFFAPAKSYFEGKSGGVFQIFYNGVLERTAQSGDMERTWDLIRAERKEQGDNPALLDFKVLYNDKDVQCIYDTCNLNNEFRKDLIREVFVKNTISPLPYNFHSRSIEFQDANEVLPQIEQAVSAYLKKLDK